MGISAMIVVAILEGKNFPVRHDKLLVVEAKFDKEVMATDPVPHVTFPSFSTEFGWEVDKKGLQMHRLQRTPIKLIWYAVDMELLRKESIGYVILDLRLAQEKQQVCRWLPLLNCKYQRDKPEVLIKLFLEKSDSVAQKNTQNSMDAQRENSMNFARTYTINEIKQLKKNGSVDSIVKNVEKPLPEASCSSSSNFFKPVLLPESSCYKIGPQDLCNENFVFSVTLAFAANLNKLTPPATLRTSKDYYFYYSLFENDVTTGRFASLSNPDFLAERASVKISSSCDLLSSYFEKNPFLELLLCCGDLALASGQIPLGPLATVNRCNIDEKPLLIEGSVQIHPIEKPTKLGTSEDLSPFVGVTVVLQKIDDRVPPKTSKITANGYDQGEKDCDSGLSRFSDNSIAKDITLCREVNGNGINGYKDSNGSLNNHGKTMPQRQSSVSSSRAETPLVQNSVGNFAQNHGRDCLSGNKSENKNSLIRNSGGGGSSNVCGVSKNSNVPHHFCFTLDICNFRASRLDQPVNVFIRYSYPFFGTSSAIQTQPNIEIAPGSIVNIPNGFCSFNFATLFGLLKTTFCESPLMLEVIHHNKLGYQQEKLIGTCCLNLAKVLDASMTPHVADKKHGTRRMSSCKASVIDVDGRELGELSAIMTLDDFGPATTLCERNSSGKSKTPVIPQLRNSLSSFDVPSMRQNGFTQEELIQAAFELEVWKERQREIFRTELKEKEMQHLKALVTEWKQRDADRESLLQRRLQECQKLENKLQQMLQDAEIKEKQLAAQETELNLRLQNFEKYQEQQEKEVKIQMDKMKMEYEDLLRIDRLNLLELEENNSNLQRKIDEQESEIREQKNIIDSLRSQQNKNPDVELKTEVNILKMEKSELQQKLETALASKQRYKIQWGQTSRQLSAMQQKVHLMERLELAKKDEELAVLQRRLMVAEGRSSPHQNDDSQSKENNRGNCLPSSGKQPSNDAEQESPSSQSASDSVTTPASTEGFLQKSMRIVETKELCLRAQQLIAQKEQLLKTGMYTENDQLIKALNNHIQNAKFSSA